MAKGLHDPRYKDLIDALMEARRRVGMTQTALAEKLGRRQQFVSKYESNERRLDIVEFVDVAQALDLDWIKLLKR